MWNCNSSASQVLPGAPGPPHCDTREKRIEPPPPASALPGGDEVGDTRARVDPRRVRECPTMGRLEFWPDYGGALLWTQAGEPLELASLALPAALRHEAVRWVERYDDNQAHREETDHADAGPT
jgi:hypothetical protein